MKIVKIIFKDKGKKYNFDVNGFDLKTNVTVIVKTERGLQFGKVASDPEEIEKCEGIKPIIRIATKNDYDQNKKNIADAKDALKKCREIVEKEKLNMRIIDATFTFDRDQLVFRFLADNRVDFRNLAKSLASIYKTRIELRQIGVRDRSKEIGGIGPCGNCLCCSRFLDDFVTVSINMAKNQNLALNPSKINGVCGRLLCCLKYEDENYKECKKCMPKIGDEVIINEGKGIVNNVNLLKMEYTVYIKDKGEIKCYGKCK